LERIEQSNAMLRKEDIPTRAMETISSTSKEDKLKSFSNSRMAPDITPVSKPNKNPPTCVLFVESTFYQHLCLPQRR